MTQAKPGDTLRLHYKGTLDDGTVFDSSEGRDPLSF
ncbi:MAG: FKBP-type peptidyl-prolyl cis-trans isomerase, partial [Paracoccaceae bacterium]